MGPGVAGVGDAMQLPSGEGRPRQRLLGLLPINKVEELIAQA